jgi:CubicO group peptidase (beta-lactamase class C family)
MQIGLKTIEKLIKYKSIGILFIIVLIIVGFCFTDTFKGIENRTFDKAKSIKPFHSQIKVCWDEKLSPQIDEWFKKLYKTSRFNGNILVAKHGKVIYENFYGYANYQLKDTLSLEHRFQTGSVSKVFTSMAILILKERGLIGFDDPVTKYIDNFPYKGVTIRLLMSHRSGLPNYNYFCDAYTDRETVIYNKDVVKLMIDSVPAAYYPPNERFNYCNTNFILLAYIVERISGMPFEDFARKEIFDKAGMFHTRIFINGKQARISKAATGYLFPWTVALTTYQDGVSGDKGVYTTVEDLWKWNCALDSNLLVKRKTLEEAFTPASPEKKGTKNYGLGWRLNTGIDGSKFVYHTGWWRGFNALFLKDLKNDAVFVILSNVRTRSLYAMFPELLGIVDPVRRKMQVDSDSLYMKKVEEPKDTVNMELEL